MNELDFWRLCCAAGRVLELPDPESFANGEAVLVQGVPASIYLSDQLPSQATLLLALGAVKESCKVEVYESLLALQGLWHGTHDCIFEHGSLEDTLFLRVGIPVSSATTADGLASVIELFALQVSEWRVTLLAGKLEGVDGDARSPGDSAAQISSFSLA